MSKMMIAVAAALALGTATMATGTMAFGRGGGEAAVGTLAAEAEVILAAAAVLAAVSGAVILAAAAVLPAVSGAVTSAEALGAALAACTGLAAHCPITATATAAVTPSRPTATLGSATEIGGVLWWRLPHRTYLQVSDRRMV
jgi:hypothetical protein